MKTIVITLALLAVARAQQNPAAAAARNWREAHERAIVAEFLELLAMPNLARDESAIRRNAAAVSALLEKRGVKTRLLEVAGAPPVVFGELPAPGATRTLIFYAHYDGQPLDPKEWATPPWQPVLRNRAARPERRPGGAAVAAAKSIPSGASMPVRPPTIKRRSSPSRRRWMPSRPRELRRVPTSSSSSKAKRKPGRRTWREIVEKNKDLLASRRLADLRRARCTRAGASRSSSARAASPNSDITVYGPRHELHSGHYGNWAPNPAMMLARLLASMKDDDGRVTIEHFYEGIEPLSETEKRAIAEAPDVDRDLMRELWLGRTEGGGKKLVELLNLPSLNVRGMSSARTGAQASNVIPATATATIDIRLVKGISTRDGVAAGAGAHSRPGLFHR